MTVRFKIRAAAAAPPPPPNLTLKRVRKVFARFLKYTRF
jgi:hypothetical protein